MFFSLRSWIQGFNWKSMSESWSSMVPLRHGHRCTLYPLVISYGKQKQHVHTCSIVHSHLGLNPLWKTWVRQLGCWHSLYCIWKNYYIKPCSKPPTRQVKLSEGTICSPISDPPFPISLRKKIVGGEDLRLGSTKQFVDVAMARKLSQVCSVYVMTRVYISNIQYI